MSDNSTHAFFSFGDLMKIAFVSDAHIGNHGKHGGHCIKGINRRCQECLDALSSAIDAANELGCAGFCVIGDLFDTDRPAPQLIHAVQEILTKFKGTRIVTLGNHEVHSAATGDHCLGPLSPVAEVADTDTVFDFGSPEQAVDLLCLPYRSEPVASWLDSSLTELCQEPAKRILCLHAGIEDSHTPSFMRDSHDSIRLETIRKTTSDHGVSLVLTGHWHSPVDWEGGSDGVSVYQVGALVPTGWDNPGLDYGRLLVVNTAAMGVTQHRLGGPRFLTANTITEAEALLNSSTFNEHHVEYKLYMRLHVPPEQTAEATKWLSQAKANGSIQGGEVQTDNALVRSAVRTAAKAAKSKTTLDEAIAAYIDGLSLGFEFDTQEVLKTVNHYLAKGQSQ
jgi:hypothetical protein